MQSQKPPFNGHSPCPTSPHLIHQGRSPEGTDKFNVLRHQNTGQIVFMENTQNESRLWEKIRSRVGCHLEHTESAWVSVL